MIKKTITYKDYDDNERTEDFYFNLTKAELMEMELTTDGGMGALLEKIVKAQDKKDLIKYFKEIILRSYGEKSPDGRRFIKSPEVREAFSQTEAYNILFMELATDDAAASAFVNGVIPDTTGVAVRNAL